MSAGIYWTESVGEALCEVGLWESTTEEQRAELASIIEGCASVEGEYTGRYNIPNPETERANKAEKALRLEMSKVGCLICNGTGTEEFISNGRKISTRCYKCNGEGKHQP